jgi:hypothetical protein
METKNMLLAAAAFLAFYSFYGGGNKEKRYFVPGVGYVKESELEDYGYQYVPELGGWYSQSQIDAAVVQAGGQSGSPITSGTTIFNDVIGILTTLAPLAFNVVNLIVSASNKPQVIEEILRKQNDPSEPHYYSWPKFTESELQAMSLSQLQNYLDSATITSINAIGCLGELD